jgi:tape measure domain-containing protein
MPKNDIMVLLGGDISGLTKALNKAEKNADKSAKAVTDSFGNVKAQLTGIFAGLQVGKGIIDTDQITASLAVIESGTETVDEFSTVWGELKSQSIETGAALAGNIDFYKRMSLGLEDLNVSQSKMLHVNDLINKSLVASGSTVEQVNSFQTQFVQGLQAGVIRGEEFNSVAESNVVMLQAMAKAYGTNVGGLRDLAKEGKITTESFLEKLPIVAGDIERQFEKMPVTITRAGNTLRTTFQGAFVDANLATEGTSETAQAILDLAGVVNVNTPTIQTLFTGIVTGAEFAVKGVTALVGLFQGAASAITTMSGHAMEFISNIAGFSDMLGVNIGTTQEWKTNAEAAFQSADDLMGKASQSFDILIGKQSDSTTAQEKYRNELKKNLAAIEEDRGANSIRLGELLEKTDQAAEKQKVLTTAVKESSEQIVGEYAEMFRAIGEGSEIYYQNEAEKILAQGEKWQELGASVLETEKWMYGKIKELSDTAWAAEDQASWAYLDSLSGNFQHVFGVISESITGVKDDVNEINNTTATVEINADTSGFDVAAKSVNDTLTGLTGGGGGTLTATLDSIGAVRDQIQMLDNNPTLDPFGFQRENLQQKIKEIQALIATNRAETIAEVDKNRAEWIKNEREAARAVAKSGYDDAVDAMKLRVDHAKKMLDTVADAEKDKWRNVIEDIENQISKMQIADFYKDPGIPKDWVDIRENWTTSGVFGSSQGMFSGLLNGSSSFAGGGYTGDMPRIGGIDGKGGFMAIMHPQETVIDNHQGQQLSNGDTINQNITINVQQPMDNRQIEELSRRLRVNDRRKYNA